MMRGIGRRLMGATLCLLAWASIQAQDITVYVVEPRGGYTPAPPYTNWAMAATSVIDAVNTATNNGWTNVVVSNGTYFLTNEIAIMSALTLRSWNNGALDTTNTILDGNNYPEKPVTNRVLNINGSALVEGFTIRNGRAIGTVAGGGGVSLQTHGTLRNCLVVSNYSDGNAGGVFLTYAYMSDCRVAHNTATNGNARGGGVHFVRSSMMSHCDISHNQGYYGGGIYAGQSDIISNCLISGNTAVYGGGICRRYNPVTEMVNCTIVSNYAAYSGGIHAFDTASYGTMINCIVYDNLSSGTSSNHANPGAWLTWTNCCTAPIDALTGADNISADPQWADFAGGNYRLQSASPCLNAGFMRDGLTNALDLDGRLRVDRIMRRVDLGAYEYLAPCTIMTLR